MTNSSDVDATTSRCSLSSVTSLKVQPSRARKVFPGSERSLCRTNTLRRLQHHMRPLTPDPRNFAPLLPSARDVTSSHVSGSIGTE